MWRRITNNGSIQVRYLCEGDERTSEEQRVDPIASEERYFEFSGEQIAPSKSFDVCVEVSGGFSDCKTLTNSALNQPEEVNL